MDPVTVSLLMEGRPSILDAKEEVLIAAERFGIRDQVKVSIDILPGIINVTTNNHAFIEFLDFCYSQRGPQRATA